MIKDLKGYYKEIEEMATDEQIPWQLIDGKSVLITGASGMIGSYLVDMLHYRNHHFQANINIYALSRNKQKLENRFRSILEDGDSFFHMIEHDICQSLEKLTNTVNSLDYVIHAASNTHPLEYATDPVGTIITNVLGTMNLAEFARQHALESRLVLLSSVEIYGENRGDVKGFEEKCMGYIDCNTLRAGYPESKRVCESLLQAYIEQYKMDGVIVRLSRVYGPNVENDDSKAMTQFIRNAVEGNNIVLKSEGKQLYSYTYIGDACLAILKIMSSAGCGEAVNVSDPKGDARLIDIAEILAGLSNTHVVYEVPDKTEKKGYSTATMAVMDGQKYRSLGGVVRIPIEEGLKRTMQLMM